MWSFSFLLNLGGLKYTWNLKEKKGLSNVNENFGRKWSTWWSSLIDMERIWDSDKWGQMGNLWWRLRAMIFLNPYVFGWQWNVLCIYLSMFFGHLVWSDRTSNKITYYVFSPLAYVSSYQTDPHEANHSHRFQSCFFSFIYWQSCFVSKSPHSSEYIAATSRPEHCQCPWPLISQPLITDNRH